VPGRTARDKYLRKTYGISTTVYRWMLKDQNGGCAICLRKPKRHHRRLAVDHDHKTKRVRGLLCYVCNRRLLGRGRENPVLHERAAIYLRNTFDARVLLED